MLLAKLDEAIARKLIEIEDMTSESCTFSVGVIHGGQWVNCVTTTCTGEALSMAKKQEDLDRGVEAMLSLRASSNEVQFSNVLNCLSHPSRDRADRNWSNEQPHS